MSAAERLSRWDVAVFCGPGGVGKTTTAAATAAQAAAVLHARVLVITVDPARRLADALGIGGLGNVERRVPADVFRAAGVEPVGELWGAVLDTRQSWDELVRRHAPDPATAQRILANRFYRDLSSRFVASHDYIAMERLHQLHSSGAWDLIVVDTPPSRHAIDLLEAPARLADFFSSRLLRWLTAPARSRMTALASRPFTLVADRLLGAHLLSEITEFFLLFQGMYGGFVQRARELERLLADHRTTFVVVTTLDAGPASEAEDLVAALARRGLRADPLVLNKLLPRYLLEEAPAALALELDGAMPELVAAAGEAGEPAAVARVLTEAARSFLDLRMVASREAEREAELRARHRSVVGVPHLESEVGDLRGLLALGDAMWGRAAEADPTI